MRILVLVNDAFGGIGGMAQFNRDFLKALCAYPDGQEVVCIGFLKPNFTQPHPENLVFVQESRGRKLRFVTAVLKTIFKRPAFDLIICSYLQFLPLACLAKLFLRCPLLLAVYGLEAWRPSRKLWIRLLVKKIDAFLSISEITRRRFLEWAKLRNPRGFIFPPAVDLTVFGPAPKNEELSRRYGLANKKILLTVGRLAGQARGKGFDEILESLPALHQAVPDIAYLIVGEGEDRRRLEQKAKDLGIRDLVVFAGYVPEQEIADHYRLADVYVMPSSGEGFGIVFLEAMACGIPVIAGKFDGGREALRNGKWGILVDPEKPVEIKNAVLEVLGRRDKTVPKGLEEFDYVHFEGRLHDHLDELFDGRRFRERHAPDQVGIR